MEKPVTSDKPQRELFNIVKALWLWLCILALLSHDMENQLQNTYNWGLETRFMIIDNDYVCNIFGFMSHGSYLDDCNAKITKICGSSELFQQIQNQK